MAEQGVQYRDEKVEEKQTASPGSSSDNEEAGTANINENALLRKLDIRLLPAVGILYLLSFLDRSNVANARIEGLADDLGMTGNQYLTGLTLYFIGYVLFEIPCNIILKRTSPRLWLPTLTIAWGIVATLLGVVQNLAGFFVARFFLGVAESGLFPGVAVAAYWFIHNYPDTAGFLTEKERAVIQARLSADSDSTHNEVFTWGNVTKALKDPKCWLYGFAFHTMSLPLYTYSLFLPSIIKSLGYTAARAQLLTIPPYAFAFITTLAVAILSERLNKRAIFVAGSAAFGAIGYIILLANTDPVGRPGIHYLGTFFAAGGIYPATALALSWPAINVSGQTKRAIANAMQISIGNCGAVLGTQLYRANDGPRYIVGHSFALGYLLANVVVSGLLYWILKKENTKREAIAEEVKEVGQLDDWTLGDDDPRWRFQY
ncbi:hypothetical protein SLS64_001252 [Diaporthe eres]|uniref:Major facilitator superfamily (MFS) profile domain-containing protein n=1 Tax=Diaporthe eres TaxID=83184 RepID=A0ABR1PR03_DIAER